MFGSVLSFEETHFFKINIFLKSAFWNCLEHLEVNKYLSPVLKVPHHKFGFLQTGGRNPSGHTLGSSRSSRGMEI